MNHISKVVHLARSLIVLTVIVLSGCAEYQEQSNAVRFWFSSSDSTKFAVVVDRSIAFRPKSSLMSLLRWGIPRYEHQFEVYIADRGNQKIRKIADVKDIDLLNSRFVEIASDHVILEVLEHSGFGQDNFRIELHKITFEGERSVVVGAEKVISKDEFYRTLNDYNTSTNPYHTSRHNSPFIINRDKEISWR